MKNDALMRHESYSWFLNVKWSINDKLIKYNWQMTMIYCKCWFDLKCLERRQEILSVLILRQVIPKDLFLEDVKESLANLFLNLNVCQVDRNSLNFKDTKNNLIRVNFMINLTKLIIIFLKRWMPNAHIIKIYWKWK